MAIQGALPVAFDDVFPHGLFATGEVSEARDWDRSTRDKHVQDEIEVLDPESGEVVRLPVWLVTVHDGDPAAKQTMTVQVVARHKPVLPAPIMGPFRSVVLDGLALEAYVNRDKCKVPQDGRPHRCGGRVAYKYWARGVREATTPQPARAGASSGKATG